MQALLCALALIFVRDAYRTQEPIVPEPYKFQPFDLQALRQVYRAKDTSPSRPSDRQESYVAQSVLVEDASGGRALSRVTPPSDGSNRPAVCR